MSKRAMMRQAVADDLGQSVVEYALVLVLISIPAVLALAAIVTPIGAALQAAADNLV